MTYKGDNLLKLFENRGFLAFVIVMFINASVDLGHKITIQNILVKSFDGELLVVLTSIINLLILLPYVMLFSASGYLNDKYSRTKITRYAAASEIVMTFVIMISYIFGWFYLSFFMTLLLAAQSAIYSPAKYGLVKKLVGAQNLGGANGMIQAITIIAILFSSFVFSAVFEKFSEGTDIASIMNSVWFIGLLLFICSIAETIFTFKIPFFKATDENVKFDKKKYFKFEYLKENLKFITNVRNTLLCTIGLAVFWGVAQLVIAVFPAHYKAVIGNDNVFIIQLILILSAAGIALGSYIAGNYCKNHIEMGIVPFGAFSMFVALLIFSNATSIFWMMIGSFSFGVGGGIFIVPLNASIQFFTPEARMGRVLAGSNFVQNIFMVVFLLMGILLVNFAVSTTEIFTLASICVFICAILAIKYLPHLFTRILVLPFFKIGYKVNVDGVNNIPKTCGVLLLGNHISWIDWIVIQIASPRPIKFAMHRSFYDIWYLKWFFKFFRVIPIGGGVSKGALEKISELLDKGEVVALFPEGHISYNGQIDEFSSGFELAVKNTSAKIVPFYIRGLWGSTFSRADRHYKKISSIDGKRALRVSFGEPMDANSTASQVKKQVMDLSFFSWREYVNSLEPMHYGWLKQAKSNLFKRSMVDSTGSDLNNLKVITAVILFTNKLKKYIRNERNIGVILPSSVMGSIINLVMFIRGKISVNLNYTLSEEILIKCANKAELKVIISSRKFVEKLKNRGFDLENSLGDRLLYLEDIAQTISKKDKICSLLQAFLLPRLFIELIYFKLVKIDDNATILFSSGSEGEPKGVVLTHKNIVANIKQIAGLINVKPNDAILASLPIFHCFGLTVTLYLPLSEGILSVHVPDPTDAQAVGKMSAKYYTTIMFGTSTFFRLYAKSKRIHPLMFSSIRYAIAGAEKLNQSVKQEFKMKFGIDIYEGYGTTETTPVVSVNTPNILTHDTYKELVFDKSGTVGLPLPGTIIKIVDPNTMSNKARLEEGLILIGGPQVMSGYYEDEERTNLAIAVIDGVRYYRSGDIGYLDDDGFLAITDRLSRFAKIGGEMISLGATELSLAEIFKEEIVFSCANLPDSKKGEKIVMLYSGEIDKDEVLARSKALPPLMQPSEIYKVDEIPVLGTGKVNFKGVKEMAITLSQN